MDKPQVFISYAHQDSAVVDAVRARLNEAGYRTWIDREGIGGGEGWMDMVPRAIRDSRFFVLMISTSSIKSKWVKKEIQFAAKNKCKILPVLLSSVRLPASWDFALGDANYIDLSTNEAAGTQQLIRALKKPSAAQQDQSPESPFLPSNAIRGPRVASSAMRDLLTPDWMPRSRYLTAASERDWLRGARAPVAAGKAAGKKKIAAQTPKAPAYDCFADNRFWLVAAATCVVSVGLAVLTGWAASLIPDRFPILPAARFFPWVALVIAGLVWGIAVVLAGVADDRKDLWDVVKNTLLYPAGLYDSDDELSRPILLGPPFNWAGSLGLAFLGGWLAQLAFGWTGSVVFYILFVAVFLVQLAWLFLEDITLYACALVIIACGWCSLLVDWFAGIVAPHLLMRISTPAYQLRALVIAGLAWGLFYCTIEADYATDWHAPLARLFEPYGDFLSEASLYGAMPFNLLFSWAFARVALEGAVRFTTWEFNPELWVYIAFGVFTAIGMITYWTKREEM